MYSATGNASRDLNYSMKVCSFTLRDDALSVSVHFTRQTFINATELLISSHRIYSLRCNDWKNRSISWYSLWEIKMHGRTVYFKALVSGNLITIIDRRSVKRLGRHRESHDASIFFTDTEEGDPSFCIHELEKIFEVSRCQASFSKFSSEENGLERIFNP